MKVGITDDRNKNVSLTELLLPPTSTCCALSVHSVTLITCSIITILLYRLTRKCILFQYFVFLFLLLCAELSVAVATLIYREDFLTGLENRLLNRFTNLYGRDSNVFTQAIDQAQYTVSGLYHHDPNCVSSPFWLLYILHKRLHVSFRI
jgi:hypothetical protein